MTGDSTRKKKLWRALSGVGFVFAAMASACCWMAWILAALGLGAGMASRFEPIRPIALVLAAVCLAGAFVASYRKIGKIDPALWFIAGAAVVAALIHQ
ncbi:MAG: hypothetical protein ACI9WU_005513 [Myxococcota bacterium]|jgi:hypothetical protein